MRGWVDSMKQNVVYIQTTKLERSQELMIVKKSNIGGGCLAIGICSLVVGLFSLHPKV